MCVFFKLKLRFIKCVLVLTNYILVFLPYPSMIPPHLSHTQIPRTHSNFRSALHKQHLTPLSPCLLILRSPFLFNYHKEDIFSSNFFRSSDRGRPAVGLKILFPLSSRSVSNFTMTECGIVQDGGKMPVSYGLLD